MSAVTKNDLSTISERIICLRSSDERLSFFEDVVEADARKGKREAAVAVTERKDRR